MRAAVGFVALAGFACGPSVQPSSDAGSEPGPGTDDEFADAAPQDSCERMDILFVIDNSISMAQEQTNLVANFPGFIAVLDEYRTSTDELLDYHVAVTTTGRDYEKYLRSGGSDYPNGSATGENGALQLGCGMTRPWIERSDPNAAATFSCIAEVGVEGPTDEMPLACTELALSERIADNTNAGFLREDALLAIVILTDEDDCSVAGDRFTIDGSVAADPHGGCTLGRPVELEPITRYSEFLNQLTGAPGRWAVAVIAGPGPDMCESSFGDAIPATRLRQLVDAKGEDASFSSVCAGDLTTALAEALATFDEACQSFPSIP